MGKMTLDEVRAVVNELDEDQQELLYLDLAFKMKKEDTEIIKSHKSILDQRWSDFASSKAGSLSLDEALEEIDNIRDD